MWFISCKIQRKGSLNKKFICVYISFVIRAIHLKLPTDSTSDVLIAALKNFMTRPGKPYKPFGEC